MRGPRYGGAERGARRSSSDGDGRMAAGDLMRFANLGEKGDPARPRLARADPSR